MTYTVILTANAVRDLEGIYEYIAINDLPEKADYVLTKLEKAFNSLKEFPDKGSYPKELSYLGIREYREIHFKPYRIIYKISEKTVYIYLIADGRRNMETLLQNRVLGIPFR